MCNEPGPKFRRSFDLKMKAACDT